MIAWSPMMSMTLPWTIVLRTYSCPSSRIGGHRVLVAALGGDGGGEFLVGDVELAEQVAIYHKIKVGPDRPAASVRPVAVGPGSIAALSERGKGRPVRSRPRTMARD